MIALVNRRNADTTYGHMHVKIVVATVEVWDQDSEDAKRLLSRIVAEKGREAI